ncbi:MAG: hypothetical protein Q8R83_00955 [Legionellaceae bacterium]|nr:hypothetical protein [Legionellaceae bacterium]
MKIFGESRGASLPVLAPYQSNINNIRSKLQEYVKLTTEEQDQKSRYRNGQGDKKSEKDYNKFNIAYEKYKKKLIEEIINQIKFDTLKRVRNNELTTNINTKLQDYLNQIETVVKYQIATEKSKAVYFDVSEHLMLYGVPYYVIVLSTFVLGVAFIAYFLINQIHTLPAGIALLTISFCLFVILNHSRIIDTINDLMSACINGLYKGNLFLLFETIPTDNDTDLTALLRVRRKFDLTVLEDEKYIVNAHIHVMKQEVTVEWKPKNVPDIPRIDVQNAVLGACQTGHWGCAVEAVEKYLKNPGTKQADIPNIKGVELENSPQKALHEFYNKIQELKTQIQSLPDNQISYQTKYSYLQQVGVIELALKKIEISATPEVTLRNQPGNEMSFKIITELLSRLGTIKLHKSEQTDLFKETLVQTVAALRTDLDNMAELQCTKKMIEEQNNGIEDIKEPIEDSSELRL